MTIERLEYLKRIIDCRAPIINKEVNAELHSLIDAEIERKIGCDECEDCSHCVNSGTRLCYEDCGDSYDSERTGKQAYKHYKPKYNCCPNCGRKLRGDE